MFSTNRFCTVIDVGCRYGIHPTWRKLKAIKYFGVDFDAEEIDRLKHKYKNNNNYKFFCSVISDEEKETKTYVMKHKGLSSLHKPNYDSFWFAERKDQGEIISEQITHTITLDKFCKDNKISTDFLKCDTEGHDYYVLSGAKNQLKSSILGIRCEVDFEETYSGEKLFTDIHSFFLTYNYFLLNLDYNGCGEPQSYFGQDRYGVLSGTDACYVKNFDLILADKNKLYDNVIKTSLFLFCNNASDVAINLINEAIEAGLEIPLHPSEILKDLEYEFLHQSYNLSNLPGDNFDKAKIDYMRYFGKNYPKFHEFYQSTYLNP